MNILRLGDCVGDICNIVARSRCWVCGVFGGISIRFWIKVLKTTFLKLKGGFIYYKKKKPVCADFRKKVSIGAVVYFYSNFLVICSFFGLLI